MDVPAPILMARSFCLIVYPERLTRTIQWLTRDKCCVLAIELEVLTTMLMTEILNKFLRIFQDDDGRRRRQLVPSP